MISRTLVALAAAVCLSGCSSLSFTKLPYQNDKWPSERRAEDLLNRMTAAEKLAMLRIVDGPNGREIPANTRLGIPAVRMAEGFAGLRGWGKPIRATGFPSGLAMAATWNPALVAQEAQVIADEALAFGRDQVFGPVVDYENTDRQSYGENPWLSARMTVAYVTGMQGEGVIATARYAGPGAESESVDAARLHEFDLPALDAAVEEAGVWSVLASGTQPSSLAAVLRDRWGFKGYVIAPTNNPGVDLMFPSPTLRPAGDVDGSVRRILRAIFGTGLFDRTRSTESGNGASVDTPAQRAVARSAAAQSTVLLKNDHAVLPLLRGEIRTIAVVGSNAQVNRMGGDGVTPDYSWKPLDGLQEKAAGGFRVQYAAGGKEAVALAGGSDAAVVFADQNEADAALIADVAKVNRRTIVVLNVGSPAETARWMAPWVASVPAIVNAWYPGQEGGHAMADVLFGDVNPSGKLPVTFRVDSQPNRALLFPFGFGLSYTTFDYSNLKIYPETPRVGQFMQVMLRVRNSGKRAGAEVLEVYVRQARSRLGQPEKQLKAFQRVELRAGEERDVAFSLGQRSLSYYDPLAKDWIAEPGQFEVLVGSSSEDIRVKGGFELFR